MALVSRQAIEEVLAERTDLLEALEGLYSAVEQGAAFIGNPDRPCEKARAAIRKAKGEQQ